MQQVAWCLWERVVGTGEGLLARAMGARAFTTPHTPKSDDITYILGAEVKLESMLFVNLMQRTSDPQGNTRLTGGDIGEYLVRNLESQATNCAHRTLPVDESAATPRQHPFKGIWGEKATTES